MSRVTRAGRFARVACVAGLALLACDTLVRGANAQGRPLPDVEAFYRAVRENLSRAQRSAHLFAYKERRTDVHTNPFGRIGTDGSRLLEVYPSATPRLTYRRLVERSGVPVPAAELAEQDRAYRAMAEEALRAAQQNPDQNRNRVDERAQRGERMIEDVVGTLQFTMEGRTMYDGTPAIVIRFAPKPAARPTTREGRIAQKFRGTVWVDEAAAEVMHLEATSFDDISFGFGILARLGEGTKATLTRRRLDGGLWMPTSLKLSGRGRAALFRRLVIDYSVEWFDYRRLPSGSVAPFLDAGVHGQSGGRPQ
jgi:hypothetical protein